MSTFYTVMNLPSRLWCAWYTCPTKHEKQNNIYKARCLCDHSPPTHNKTHYLW